MKEINIIFKKDIQNYVMHQSFEVNPSTISK